MGSNKSITTKVMKTLNNGSQGVMICYFLFRFFVTSGFEKKLIGIVSCVWLFGLMAGIIVAFKYGLAIKKKMNK